MELFRTIVSTNQKLSTPLHENFTVAPHLLSRYRMEARFASHMHSYSPIVTMLREQLIPALEERHYLEAPLFIHIQDLAPPHIAKPVKKLPHFWCGPSHKQRFRKRPAPAFTET
ncbi:hypothetical protein TNCV_4329911 [Trichonephila clavipes]|nr:hypothetical protein TNCV_4329911 [Trichonephila clavipes]